MHLLAVSVKYVLVPLRGTNIPQSQPDLTQHELKVSVYQPYRVSGQAWRGPQFVCLSLLELYGLKRGD